MILTFSLMLTNFSFAETYYFKGCNLSEKYLGHYLIDLDKKEIRVLFQEKMGNPSPSVPFVSLISPAWR